MSIATRAARAGGHRGTHQARRRHRPLWDNVIGLASFPGFAEMKRSLREQPQLASFGVEPDGTGLQEDWTSLGAYADVRLIDTDDLVPVPDTVSLDVAAAILTKSLLAWVLTHRLHRIEPGRTVVVGPAAGGVGSLLSWWAQSLGARVIATVGSSAKADTLADAGFDHVLISRTPGAAAPKIRELVGDRGVDVLYDGVGGSGFDRLWRTVRPGGKVILFGTAAGSPDLDPSEFASAGVTFAQPSTAQYVDTPAVALEGTAAVFDAYTRGVFGDISPTVYPLSNVAAAQQDLQSRRTSGPVILDPSA